MAADSSLERLTQNITSITTMVVTGGWLAAMFLGFGWWLPLMLVGYIVIVPVVAILFDPESDIEEWEDSVVAAPEPTGSTDSDPLADLRRRYANGELTDEQFEQKVETLLQTETREDANEWRRDDSKSTEEPESTPARESTQNQ